ncbi:MAG: metal-dependent hydrolase [Methanoculleus sp.]|jgi:inner membrane protein
MRGDQHVYISLTTAGLFIAPWVSALDPVLIATILFGVFVGSLAPDADAADAAIFSGRFGGTKGRRGQIMNGIAVVLPIFGYTIRYLIYYPLSLIFSIILRKSYRHRHRGLLHSLAGVGLTSLLLSGYLALILVWLGVPLTLLPAFGLAFFAGCILHLMEDTCTPAGVAWLYPFSRRRLAGSVRTWGNLEVRPEIFAVALALTTAAVLIAPVATSATLEELRLLTPGAAILLWLFFMLACRVQPQQNR